MAIAEYKKKNSRQVLFWKFCQYKFFIQWNRLKKYVNSRGIEIIGDMDMPMYMILDSADVWGNRKLFCLGKNDLPERAAG